MEPTRALRDRLRKMVNDMIPEGGTDSDATFSDGELDDFIRESSNIYYVASELWTLKAGMLQGDIESYSAGNEKYDLTKLKDKLSFYLSMSERYRTQAKELDEDSDESQTSVMLKFSTPDVM